MLWRKLIKISTATCKHTLELYPICDIHSWITQITARQKKNTITSVSIYKYIYRFTRRHQQPYKGYVHTSFQHIMFDQHSHSYYDVRAYRVVQLRVVVVFYSNSYESAYSFFSSGRCEFAHFTLDHHHHPLATRRGNRLFAYCLPWSKTLLCMLIQTNDVAHPQIATPRGCCCCVLLLLYFIWINIYGLLFLNKISLHVEVSDGEITPFHTLQHASANMCERIDRIYYTRSEADDVYMPPST